MANISASNLSIIFPHYQNYSRSIKNLIIDTSLGRKNSFKKDGIYALDDLSFEIKKGQKVGLVGPNGSGKTTLLRVLSGIFHPSKGSLSVQGNIASLIDLSGGFDQDATGYENIFLRSILFGQTKQETNKRVEEIIDFSELGEFIKMPVRTYSSGMMMRLAFSIATSVKPDIILMDEWLSVGDATFHEKATRRLNQLVEDANILVMASHNEDIIKNVCSRVLSLENGVIISDASSL